MQRAAVGGGDAQGQRAGIVHAAGVNGGAGFDLAPRGLAGDQTFVEIGQAADHDAVGRHPLARPHQQPVAGVKRSDRDADQLVAGKAMGRFRLQRRQIAGDRSRLAAHGMIERAPDQQEEQQHDRGIVVGVLGVMGGLHHRHGERQDDAERNRHIHIERAGPQTAPGAEEERPAGIGRRRQRDQRRGPMEEIARLRRDIGRITRPHRHRQQHDVHGGKAGNRKTAREAARLGGLFLFGCAKARRDDRDSRRFPAFAECRPA